MTQHIVGRIHFQALRRALLLGALAATLAIGVAHAPAHARDAGLDKQSWVATWTTAPAGPPLAAQELHFGDQTLRLIVHTSIGGASVRVRLSNELSDTPLRIGAAHVAVRASGAAVVPGTDRVLTFGGFPATTIPAGAPALSDPVELPVAALGDLAISIYLPDAVRATTIHGAAFQTNYLSTPGDHTADATLPVQSTLQSWPFISAVDVGAAAPAAAIVALGDSISDGYVTTPDANHRWPDLLALRLQTTRDSFNVPTAPGAAGTSGANGANGANSANGAFGTSVTSATASGQAASALQVQNSRLAVVNKGIGGDRLLRDPGEQPLFGRAVLTRFDRDVLATAGAEYVIVLIGINDIGQAGTGTIPASEGVTPNDVIAGYRQLIARAHEKGLAIFGATLTPFEGTVFPGYYSPEKELVRMAVNQWIRSSDEYDGVIDFDKAVRDPDHPSTMLPAFDSGDHLHPNDLGMQAMANAVPLALFRGSGFARLREQLKR